MIGESRTQIAEPARTFHDVGVVNEAEPAVVGDVVNEGDQHPKHHRADAGHDPDYQRESTKRQQTCPPLLRGDGSGIAGEMLAFGGR